MVDIAELPDNPISKEDRAHLEAFGAHSVGHGRTTHWDWSRDVRHGDCFRLYSCSDSDRLAARIVRDRRADAFRAFDGAGEKLVEGDLDHVMAVLDRYLIDYSGEFPDTPA